MNSQKSSSLSVISILRNRLLVLCQFFMIIFVYHLLKDLKDTLVITASDAGARVIPFIKIWAMLPAVILASYLFTRLYRAFGRETTFYVIVCGLLSLYAFFAFVLFPHREILFADHFADFLSFYLPQGFEGLITMIRYWMYTLFYVSAELWSVLILSVLFWGYINDNTCLEEAKLFYPICVFTANIAGIFSGQISRFLCQSLAGVASWEVTMQVMVASVIVLGLLMMVINWRLDHEPEVKADPVDRKRMSLRDCFRTVSSSPSILCIAIMVVGFGFTTNLIEVIWKGTIKEVHTTPHEYNAYVNQLTSLIGFLSVFFALASRWAYQRFTWTSIAIATPVVLLLSSSLFFIALQVPSVSLKSFSHLLGYSPEYLIMTLGSLYYVCAITAKYTIFDSSKEMAFLSFSREERVKAKAVIDSIGSRLGKSGASCTHQILMVTLISSAAYVPIVGVFAVLLIGVNLWATKTLGEHLSEAPSGQPEFSN